MKNGKELAEAMETFINGANSVEIEDFANGFVNMHNTLEQMAVGMLIKTLQKVSESTQVDARNEACVKASKLMLRGYRSELIKDLMESDSYWTEDKANEWVNGGRYDISKLPLVKVPIWIRRKLNIYLHNNLKRYTL
jgi:hypothetical protein